MNNYIKYLEETYVEIHKTKDWGEAVQLYLKAIALQFKTLIACTTGYIPVILYILALLSVPYLIIKLTVSKFRKMNIEPYKSLYQGETFELVSICPDYLKTKSKLKFKANAWFVVWFVVASFLTLPITIAPFCSHNICTFNVILWAILPALVYLVSSYIVYRSLSENYNYHCKWYSWHIFTLILNDKLCLCRDSITADRGKEFVALYALKGNINIAVSREVDDSDLNKLWKVDWKNKSTEEIISTLKQLLK